MSRYQFAFLLCFSGAIGVLDCAVAADVAMPRKALPAPAPVVSPWTYRITPYFWAPSLTGTSTVVGQTANVDVTFIDLLHRQIPRELFGVMGNFEMRNDRFAVFADLAYLMAGASSSGQKSIVFGPYLSAGAAGSATVKFQMTIAELAAAYEVARWGGMSGAGTALDIYGGGRLWWQKAEADVAVNAALNLAGFTISGSRAVAGSGDVTWVDPIVGLRLRHQLAPGHEVRLSGDVGGFGVGSEFSWQLVGAYSFDVARTRMGLWSGMLGYRALYVDFSKGSGTSLYQYDVLQQGPVMGLSLKF
ncbi:MAG TPA: hypothetical protein VM867_03560 [Xanthobacteraceae bacterium]|nr:hypothetical protein [Xanthobacteraceae bacterium]